jgi:ATP synthase I chain
MDETAHIDDSIVSAPEEDHALETRMMRVMVVAIALAVIISGVVAPWRVTTGLLLGGGLSIFNYQWLHGSTRALVDAAARSGKVSSTAWRYVLRYFVIAAIVFIAYKLKLISLPAAIIGLCSFVVALFAEAFRQFYFAILNREGIH